MTFAPSFDHSSILHSNATVAPRASKEPRGIVRVLTKNVRYRTKIVRSVTADDTLSDIRPIVETMVRGEEYVTGSKMRAYENVARAIGKSPSWVRKLIGRHEVGLQGFAMLNIARAYATVCERIEAAAAAERLRAEQLRGWADAPVERAAGLVPGPMGPGQGEP